MRLEIDIAEHHYNNIMALDSVSLGRVPYKGIIMYSINAIKHGKVLEQEPTPKNEAKCCDRNICLRNEYNNVGCEDCEVTKSQEPTKNDLGVDCISKQALYDALYERFHEEDTNNITNVTLGSVRNFVKDFPSVTPQEPMKKCKWIKYDHRTMCPKEHDIDSPYWRIPEDRMETLKYCPYCGKEIEVEE